MASNEGTRDIPLTEIRISAPSDVAEEVNDNQPSTGRRGSQPILAVLAPSSRRGSQSTSAFPVPSGRRSSNPALPIPYPAGRRGSHAATQSPAAPASRHGSQGTIPSVSSSRRSSQAAIPVPGAASRRGSQGNLPIPVAPSGRRESQSFRPERRPSSAIIEVLNELKPERRMSQALRSDYNRLNDSLLPGAVSNIPKNSDGYFLDVADFSLEEAAEEVNYDVDDDDDVRDDSDREASSTICCGEMRVNCGRFAAQMSEEGQEMKECCGRIDCKRILRKYISVDMLKRRFPILTWAPNYRMAEFQGDLIAGATVGMTVIPQSIAYAFIAGVPPQYGLYSAFIGSFVYVLLGSSKDVCLGPSAVSSLLTATFAVSPVANDASLAILMTFFCGLIYFGMALFSLGFIMDFFSFPVIKAFTVAAAVTIAASQVKKWLGLVGVPRDFIPQLWQTIKKIPEARLYDFLLGVACIILIVVLKKMKEAKWKTRFSLLPLPMKILNKTVWFCGTARNIIVLVLASAAAFIFMQHQMRPFNLTGYITPGIPSFKPPPFSLYDPQTNVTYSLQEMTSGMGAGLVIVPLIGILEEMSIVNPLCRKANYRVDVNQELLAHGVGNILTSFFSGYAICGTFSRTAVNAGSGVKTPAGGIWTGAIVLISLQYLTPLFYYIPEAALAVVVIMAVVDMITFHKLWIFWKTRKVDLIPWFLTLILSFVISIAYGVLIGAGLSIVLLLFPTSRPKIKKLQHDPSSLLNCKHIANDGSKIIMVTFNSSLMYPAVEYLKDKLIPLYDTVELPKGVILDFQHVSVGDTTTVQGIRMILENMAKKGIPMVMCGMRKAVDDLFTKSNVKHFIKVSTLEEAVVMIYGLKKNQGPGVAAKCEGFVDTCPWVQRVRRFSLAGGRVVVQQKRRLSHVNHGYQLDEGDAARNGSVIREEDEEPEEVKGVGQRYLKKGETPYPTSLTNVDERGLNRGSVAENQKAKEGINRGSTLEKQKAKEGIYLGSVSELKVPDINNNNNLNQGSDSNKERPGSEGRGTTVPNVTQSGMGDNSGGKSGQSLVQPQKQPGDETNSTESLAQKAKDQCPVSITVDQDWNLNEEDEDDKYESSKI